MTVTRSPQVSIRELSSQRYLAKHVRAATGSVGGAVQAGFAELYERIAAAGAQVSGMPFLIAERPSGEQMEIELGVPCAEPPSGDDLVARTLPGGRAVVLTFRGRYEDIGPQYDALAGWIAEHGHSAVGSPREVYLTGPETRPEEHVTELVWPIA